MALYKCASYFYYDYEITVQSWFLRPSDVVWLCDYYIPLPISFISCHFDIIIIYLQGDLNNCFYVSDTTLVTVYLVRSRNSLLWMKALCLPFRSSVNQCVTDFSCFVTLTRVPVLFSLFFCLLQTGYLKHFYFIILLRDIASSLLWNVTWFSALVTTSTAV